MESQLKEMLRRDNIKLWLPPYTNQNFVVQIIPEDLVKKYSREKRWSLESVRDCMVRLQTSSITRMIANKKFSETGVATVFVSCVKHEIKHETTSLTAKDAQKVEISLTLKGKILREAVGKKFSLPLNHFKLIAAGRVVEESAVLQEQGVGHLSEILCVTLTTDEVDHQRQLIWQMSVDQTKNAVSKLSDQVQIADQNGKTLELPEEEKIALSTGIALHEKGKKELKTKQVGLALLCFLEADKEFSRCRGAILRTVDNYAILCLDIVWCYLQLQSVNSLPDADTRLKEAESGFRRSYGKNFERLADIKRGVEHEKVLIIRLQLLQGILAYYNKNYKKAFHLLTEAEVGIRQLDVDGEKLVQSETSHSYFMTDDDVMKSVVLRHNPSRKYIYTIQLNALSFSVVQMGYTESEARLGLRATNGNIESAIQRIIEDREEGEKLRKEEYRKLVDKHLQSKLGKTKNGRLVDMKNYRSLLSMGYIKQFAVEALKVSNNDLNAALEILHEKKSKGEVVSSSYDKSHPKKTTTAKVQSPNSAMQQLIDMGFVSELMHDIMTRHHGDINGAIAELLHVADSLIHTSKVSKLPSVDREQLKNIITEAVNEALSSSDVGSNEDSDEEAAWTTLEEDVPEDLNAHLDATLEEEHNVLMKYKELVLPHVQ